ncbi:MULTISPECIES: protein-disulfide reductase DsbD family protein [Halocynthiibacter]|uniref:Protein-disulfide reductase DsbD family protein n=1 Tax=Halocynthiibacter halioticoli TaxID=2986804 RepID=A0AAE3J1B4_9RHOB|nr:MULTISPECIES: protein-disulfide reductase DsbD domain-containing protein [Halocynthiibacter]MCV6825849.1 protein-disulfide reductase DsbD family protein [Halocynthiibacter halioticoli]MCW4058850.1 protein-disulfide reductase DsbD family protein [Halocynthiibacter sp. SDUM655004]
MRALFDKRKAQGLLAAGAMALVSLSSFSADAAQSDVYTSPSLNGALITAQDGIAPGATTVSAGLHLEMAEGWKTYWRSPGEVGLPPELDWSASENVANVEFQYPAPTRFRAFGIENFGYNHEVVFPLQITLEDAGKPARLAADVELLVCADTCIPDSFSVSLDLPEGVGIDADAAGLIGTYAAKVPLEGEGVQNMTAAIADDVLTVAFQTNNPMQDIDVFPEYGEISAFGAPDIRVDDNSKEVWAAFPVLGLDEAATELRLTVTGSETAISFPVELSDNPATPPYDIAPAAQGSSVILMVFVALLGGLILNVMPCVLPVLSIKLASALKMRDKSPARVRGGFLATTLGVLAFMWSLAIVLVAMRAMGQTVGWGLQFQSPIFLTIMLFVLGLFAANMVGLFEIQLPQSWTTKMAASPNSGYFGDFATGALAAVLATPCSAPFLGTAVAFALAGNVSDVLLIFTALGVGLSMPYLLFAVNPALIKALPKPGAWMDKVKIFLGLLLAGTAVWLATVLYGVVGLVPTLIVAVAIGLAIVIVAAPLKIAGLVKTGAVAALFAVSIIVPQTMAPAAATTVQASYWQPFDRAEIPKLVADGKTVFVDVTADWCLTCKANKKIVLERQDISDALGAENVVALIADWTRQDEDIAKYLRSNGRYGVPFNIVYGPHAPDGIPLPEILTPDLVREALSEAAGS